MKYSNLKIKTNNPMLDKEISEAKKKGFYFGLRSKKVIPGFKTALYADVERDLNLLKAGFYEGMAAGVRNRKK